VSAFGHDDDRDLDRVRRAHNKAATYALLALHWLASAAVEANDKHAAWQRKQACAAAKRAESDSTHAAFLETQFGAVLPGCLELNTAGAPADMLGAQWGQVRAACFAR
jgi:hypothetical protein